MRHLALLLLSVTLLLCAAGPSLAATPSDFYLDLLKKGVAEFDAARYDGAVSVLRVAAFGLMESPNHYQTAQIYRAIAADKMNDPVVVRDAARRTLAAERVQRSYALLSLPASVRTSFESVAKKVLAPSEMTMLTSGAAVPSPENPNPAPQPETKPLTPPQTNRPPVAKPQQKPVETKPAPKTVPPPVKQEPAPKAETPKAETPKVETQKVETQRVETPKVETQKPATPKPEPPKPQPPKVETPKVETPKVEVPAKPAPKPEAAAPVAPPRDVVAMLAASDRALMSGNLPEARRVYRLLLDGALTHEQAIRVAEGLYRSRDFANVLRAFDRVGQLRRGEEPYRFYLAVALYESGRFAAAKKELAAVLDFIEITPDVARYKTKIESSGD